MSEQENERLKHQFTASINPIATSEDAETKRRTFEAEVYSGGLIDNHYFWGRNGVVIDLQNIQLKSKIGLVDEHFGGKRIGVATSFDVNDKFKASGHFLTNPKAQEIVADMDDGYPFQMSWWADPETIEEVKQGTVVTVNGKQFTGPLHIFRNVRVHEITICGVGADTETSVQAFSSKSNQQINQQEDTSVDLDQAKARIAELETERDTAQAELKQFKSKQRQNEINALEAELKTQFSVEDKAAYAAMDDASFSFTAKQLRQFSGKNSPTNNGPSNLFTHQAKSDGNEKQTFGAGSLVDQAKQRK